MQIYRRNLTGSMVKALLVIAKAVEGRDWARSWVRVPPLLALAYPGDDAVTRGGDWVKMTEWDLIEGPRRVVGHRSAGVYRMTRLGLAFVAGRARVPAFRWIFMGQSLGWSKRQVRLQDVLGGTLER